MDKKDNKTWRILQAAEKGGYGVACVNCYNMDAVIGTIRAAEAQNSPAMIEIFPWSIHQFGDLFVNFIADACSKSKVPVALHLDHAMEEDVIIRALDMKFDSVMIDMSRHSEEENVVRTKKLASLAREKGIVTEAELGRIDGGEDGVMSGDIEALITKPEEAAQYVEQTGVDSLAPSFGNIHGDYPDGNPRTFLKLDVLSNVYDKLKATTKTPIVLHGTNDFDKELMQECVKHGVRKVNVNNVVAQEYYDYTEKNFGKVELTKVIEGGIDRFQRGVEEMMQWLGSSNQAPYV